MDTLDKIIDLMERIDRGYRQYCLLTEGAETRNMNAAKHYLYNRFGYNEQQALKTIGAIKHDIPNVRGAKCKFLLGVTRMYCDRQLTDGETVNGLNRMLRLITSGAHVNEYNQDLNGMSAEDIIERFSGMAKQDLEQDRQATAAIEHDNIQRPRYNIVRIDSFEESETYGQYTSWCVTQDEQAYNQYIGFGGLFYFCLREGFENEPRTAGENCPLDSYGLSMIAVSVNEDGSANTITCRWNHANGGNDSIMTPQDLTRLIGRDFYKTFLPLTAEEIRVRRMQVLYTVDEELSDLMDYYQGDLTEFSTPIDGDENEEMFYRYSPENASGDVIINSNGERINDEMYGNVSARYREGDFVMVTDEKNEKKGIVNLKTGERLLNAWFDYIVSHFKPEGYAVVGIKNKGWKILYADGSMSNKWYYAMTPIPEHVGNYSFRYDIIEVCDGKKFNYISFRNPDNPIFPQWFDEQKTISTQSGRKVLLFRYGDYWLIQDRHTGKQLTPYSIRMLLGHDSEYNYIVELSDGRECIIDNNLNAVPIKKH